MLSPIFVPRQRTGKILGEKVIRYFEERLKSRVSQKKKMLNLNIILWILYSHNIMQCLGHSNGETSSKELHFAGEET